MLSLQHYLALQEARARKMSYVDIGHQEDALRIFIDSTSLLGRFNSSRR